MDDDTRPATRDAAASAEGLRDAEGAPEDQGASADRTGHVGFAVADQAFAFGMEKVLEIIRFPHTVAVPMTPPAFVGLANLRGRVLPVLDFRALVGLPGQAHDEATRVIVVDVGQSGGQQGGKDNGRAGGQVVGLVVDRVQRVMQVEAREIEAAADMDSLVGGELLDGVVKQPGGALVQLVDPARIVGRAFAVGQIDAATHGALTLGDRHDTAVGEGASDDEASRLISVLVSGQEYGLPIEHVDEIVRVPDTIGTVPSAPPYVHGIITLRNRVLPLVCMRRVLNLPARDLNDGNRVVVIQLAEAGGGMKRIGLVVDRVNAVIRVDPKVVSEVPELLAAHGDVNEISAICRLDDGRRLVSILSIERMFQRGAIDPVAQGGSAAEAVAQEGETTLHTLEGAPEADERQAIVFQMVGQEFGLMVEHVKEILRVPEEMNKVPRTADFVAGVMNLRGGVLPVMDMRTRLGLPRQDRSDRQRVVVVELDGRRTGFIVDGVSEVLRMPASALIDTPKLSALQQQVLGRAAKLDGGRRLILIVDPLRLLDEAELATLRGVDAAA